MLTGDLIVRENLSEGEKRRSENDGQGQGEYAWVSCRSRTVVDITIWCSKIDFVLYIIM